MSRSTDNPRKTSLAESLEREAREDYQEKLAPQQTEKTKSDDKEKELADEMRRLVEKGQKEAIEKAAEKQKDPKK